MGKVISLVETKGGICKSTLALSLAGHYKNTCIIDLDPQACLWSWYNFRMANQEESGGQDAGVVVEFYGLEDLSLERIDELAALYDYVIIDCPGESEAGQKTRTALVYSDLVIIPVQESEFDINSLLDNLAPLLEDAKEANTKGGKIVFLPVFVHPLANLEKVTKKFEGLGVDVLSAAFRTRSMFKRFSQGGKTLPEYEKIARSQDRVQAWEGLKDIKTIAEKINEYLTN